MGHAIEKATDAIALIGTRHRCERGIGHTDAWVSGQRTRDGLLSQNMVDKAAKITLIFVPGVGV